MYTIEFYEDSRGNSSVWQFCVSSNKITGVH